MAADPEHPTRTVLVRVSGRDRPGITAGLMRVLDGAGADIEDMEQVVLHGRLELGLAVTVPGGRDLLKELLLFGWEHEVEVDFEVADEPAEARPLGHVVTVVGERLGPDALGLVADAIAGSGGNIERIARLARYPVWSYELVVAGGDPVAIRTSLLTACAEHRGVEVAVQAEGLSRRAQRLVVLDVDSTLIQDEVVDLVAEAAGVGPEVAALTDRAMAGELDYEASLRERTRLLAGTDAEVLEQVADRVRMTPGAATFVRTLRRLGYATAVVSGGFLQVVEVLRSRLGIDRAHANVLEVVDGRLTGELVGEVVDRAGKARLLERIAADEGVPLDQVVAVGDGANDVDMLSVAGLGIAFNARQPAREAADATLSVPYLDAVLFLLGVTREEIEAADAADAGPAR